MMDKEVTIKFKINRYLTKEQEDKIVYDIVNEIQDRFMYITEVNVGKRVLLKLNKEIMKGKNKCQQ